MQSDMFEASQQPPAQEEEKKEDSPALRRWMERQDRLAAIPLPEVLEALGAVKNRRDPSKWKLEGVGNIVFKGQRWLNGNTNVPGFGAVRLVMHALDEERPTPAMNWLASRFPSVLEGDWVQPEEMEEKEVGFSPPERNDRAISMIRDYLVGRRGLPETLVDKEIEAGRIYATEYRSKDDETGEWTGDFRAVFIGPSSAELRSIDSDGFKGCCPGSDSERSGYQVMFRGESDRRFGLVEAAIDALSYNALHPGRYVYSTNGSGRFHLQYRLALEAWRNGFSTDVGMDADHAGDLAAQLLFNALLLRDRLAKEADMQPEQVDEWLLTNRIIFQSVDSPHTLFWSTPSLEDGSGLWPVMESQLDKEDRSKKILVDTGKVSPPTIVYRINKACGAIKAGKYEIQISPDEIRGLEEKYRIYRDRPVLGKDWNDTWIKVQRQQASVKNQEKQSSEQVNAIAEKPAFVPTGKFARRPR